MSRPQISDKQWLEAYESWHREVADQLNEIAKAKSFEEMRQGFEMLATMVEVGPVLIDPVKYAAALKKEREN